MRGMSRKQVVIFAIGIIFMVIFFLIQAYQDTKYCIVRGGEGHYSVPKRIVDKCEFYVYEGYSMLQSDDYFIVGIGPDCKSIDSYVLNTLNISFKDIEKVNSIKYAYELNNLIGTSEGKIIDSSKIEKPSYELFFLQYRTDDCDEMIFVHRAENKSVIEIVVSPTKDISQSEINHMLGIIR